MSQNLCTLKQSAFRLQPTLAKFALAFVVIALARCTSAPTQPQIDGSMIGQWHGKMLINDKANHKQNTVSIDAIAQQPSQLRLEVSSTWGIALASIAMNGDQLTYVLPRQHRFVKTTATAESMGHLVSIPLDPHVIMDVLFGHTPQGDGWVCTRSMMPTCKNEAQNVEIKISRDGDGQHLSFDAPRASGQWNYKPDTTKVQVKSDTFVLNAPSGYKTE